MTGRSTTCLQEDSLAGTSERSRPQQVQYWGIWSIRISGEDDISRVCPLWSGWPPGFRPVSSRRLCVFLGRFSSLEGGTELLVLFFGFLYWASSFSSSVTRISKNLILSKSRRFRSTNSAICLSLWSKLNRDVSLNMGPKTNKNQHLNRYFPTK